MRKPRAEFEAETAIRKVMRSAGFDKIGVSMYMETVSFEVSNEEVEPAFDFISLEFGFDEMTTVKAISFDGWIIKCREPRKSLT